MDKNKLVVMYCYICNYYDNELYWHGMPRIANALAEIIWNPISQMQNAAKVRSTPGLLVHIFDRLSAACYSLAFNS